MTAVEIFFNDLVNQGFIEYKEDSLVQNIFNAALELEKQQIIEAYNDDQAIPPFDYAEKYYDRNYKRNKL
jgi:hypothetical protein